MRLPGALLGPKRAGTPPTEDGLLSGDTEHLREASDVGEISSSTPVAAARVVVVPATLAELASPVERS